MSGQRPLPNHDGCALQDAGKSSRLGFPRMRTLEVLDAFVSLLSSHSVFQSDFASLCSPSLWNTVLVPDAAHFCCLLSFTLPNVFSFLL
jgi:hypothetical protein